MTWSNGQEEWVDADTGLSIDIYLPNLHLAIEVDGPSHFAEACSSSGRRQPLGGTVLKRRLLRETGFRLGVVPFWEWESAAGAHDKYLLELIGQV